MSSKEICLNIDIAICYFQLHLENSARIRRTDTACEKSIDWARINSWHFFLFYCGSQSGIALRLMSLKNWFSIRSAKYKSGGWPAPSCPTSSVIKSETDDWSAPSRSRALMLKPSGTSLNAYMLTRKTQNRGTKVPKPWANRCPAVLIRPIHQEQYKLFPSLGVAGRKNFCSGNITII